MPTPKFTPGARLFPINFVAPAFQGLNTELAGGIVGQEWATVLDNIVFDSAGRPAARKGMSSLTSSPHSLNVQRIFEYYKADGTSSVIWTSDDDIYKTVATPASIDGTLTITDGNIKFVNFNDKCIAFGIGASGVPAVYTGTTFASITVNSGTAPTSGIGTAAFGRLWAVDTDGKTLRYSSLLDETRWTSDGSGDGGSIDFSKVWPAGQDDIVAVEEFLGDLVVFGSNNTVIMTDGQGSALGINPLKLYVSDTIPGVGAISQFGIERVAGDLWVLTTTGVISLGRELQYKSTPFDNVSRHVQAAMIHAIDEETNLQDVTICYSPKEAFALVIFPTSQKTFCFDTRSPMQDGAFRCTTWTLDLLTAAYIRGSRKIHLSIAQTVGEVMDYLGNDDDKSSYIINYESGWLDLGEELNVLLKFVKRMTSFLLVSKDVVVTHKVAYDFGLRSYSIDVSATGGRTIQWGLFEWSDGTSNDEGGVYNIEDTDAVAGVDIAEYAGGSTLQTLDVPHKGGGQYIKVGLSLDNNSGDFALQQINLYAKVGRNAT